MNRFNIIGFGKMGIQISSLLMIMGYEVNIYTKNIDNKIKKLKISNKIFEKFYKIRQRGKYNFFDKLSDLPKNHTIETLVEDLNVKKEIISKINYDFNDVSLFTNTSSYIPTEIHIKAKGLHFFNPIYQLRIIETTCLKNEMNNLEKNFFEDLQKLNFKIFHVKNNRGYIFNYIYFNKIALYYELIEKYGYKSEEIIEVLDSINIKNNFEEIIKLVGKNTTGKIIDNLLKIRN
jgi:3-hydroxyacyl-CoA dehydrogenase